MTFYLIVLVTVLNHIAFKGSKVLVSLYALEPRATGPAAERSRAGARRHFRARGLS